jgi:NADH dehydrogenase
MARQIERQMHGKRLLLCTYHDFGSLVPLGKWSTVGGLMGFLFGRGFFVEGLFAHIMYRSLRVMHEAVGGTLQALLGIFVRALANRAGPRVKLLC